MGRLNSELIKAAELAKKKYGMTSPERAKAEKLVDESQKSCIHEWKKTVVSSKNSPKVKAGDILTWCTDCSKPLFLNHVEWKKVYPSS